MEKLLTIEQVAEILQVSTRTVRRYIKAGRLPSINLGERIVRVSEGDLGTFIDQGRAPRQEG